MFHEFVGVPVIVAVIFSMLALYLLTKSFVLTPAKHGQQATQWGKTMFTHVKHHAEVIQHHTVAQLIADMMLI